MKPEIEEVVDISPMRNWVDEPIEEGLVQEQQDLQFTRNKRKQIVSGLMCNGVPQDPKILALTLTVLTDMDRTSIARARIKSDEKKGDITSAAADMIAKALMQVNGSSGARTPTNATVAPPSLPDTVDLSEVTEGVMRQGTSIMTYDTFVKLPADAQEEN